MGDPDFRIDISNTERDRIEHSYETLQRLLESKDQKVYGLHTGFGRNIDDHIEIERWRQHQQDLLDYLCVGIGPELSNRIVQTGLRLQLKKFAKGLSGLHPETFQAFETYCNSGPIPSVPCFGSLGASGDLIPMAHATRPFFIEHGIKGPRDVLATVNTNAMMSAFAIDCWQKLQSMVQSGLVFGSLSSLALGVENDAFDPMGLDPSFQRPQLADIGRWMGLIRNRLLSFATSEPLQGEFPIQERYSVRCMPQILNSILTKMSRAADSIYEEASSVSDNPLVLTDDNPRIWHGGHFYAQGIADACDLLQDSIQQLIEMIDRQVLLLVTPETNHGLPANLALQDYNHVKGIHQLLSALRQQARTHSQHSVMLGFSCESYNQDVVPAGMSALNNCAQLLDRLADVLRAGCFCADRAFRLRYSITAPHYLKLSQWPNYRIEDTLESFSEDRRIDEP